MATFADIANDIGDIVFEALSAGGYQAQSLLEERIFVKHLTQTEKPFGTYSYAYGEYRQSLTPSLQIVSKDLQLTGDLRRSMVQEDNKVIFNNTVDAEKAVFQETSEIQINKKIFALNQEETDDCLRVIDEIFVRLIKEKMDGITITI
jgi:hypothetical protein